MRRIATAMFVAVMVMAVAIPAGADRSTCEDDPTRPWCEPSEPPPATGETGEWCQTRIENGAIWQLGEWLGGHYLIDAPAGCVDIEGEYRELRTWTVSVRGETRRGTTKGMKLVFERGIHGVVYDQIDLTEFSVVDGVLEGEWPTVEIQGDPVVEIPYVFVSMPHAGDRWNWIEIKVTPNEVTATP